MNQISSNVHCVFMLVFMSLEMTLYFLKTEVL